MPATMASVVYGRVLIDFVDRIDEMAGDLAHGAGRLAALVLRLGNGVIDARFGAAPCGVAGTGDDARDLIRDLGEFLAQCLQISFQVAGSGGRGLAGFPHSLASRFASVVCRCRRGAHGLLSVD